jgi:hypothetical protein
MQVGGAGAPAEEGPAGKRTTTGTPHPPPDARLYPARNGARPHAEASATRNRDVDRDRDLFVRRARSRLSLGREHPLQLLELGLQLAVLALEKHDAPPLGHEILGHLAQRASNPLGSDLLHVA